MCRLLVIGLLLGIAGGVRAVTEGAEPAPLATSAELTAAIARLNDPATRLPALRQLIASGRWELYQVGSVSFVYDDAGKERIAKGAADAAADAADLQTVSAALDAPDWDLQFYGIWFCGVTDPKRFPERAVLIPKIKKLAVTGDATVRAEADQRLQQLPGFGEFLAQRAREETDLMVIMRLVHGSNGAGYASAMNEAAARLLQRTEEPVRRDALGFIGSNSRMAPMWQAPFNRAVFDRVVQLSTSKSSAERTVVAAALGDSQFQSIAPVAARATLLKLTSDSEADVRSRAILALQAQRAEPTVQSAIQTLLHDPSPLVVYYTILADGPLRHRSELDSLTKCADREISESARGTLTAIAQSGK